MLAGEAPGIEAKLAIFELPAEGEPRLLGLHENAAPVHAIALRDRQLWISDERCTLRMGQLDADGRIEDEACARLASTPARRIVLDEGLAVLVFHASIWFVDGSRPERPDFIATASVSAAALDGLSGGRSWLVATASGGIQVVGIEAGDGLQVLSSLAVGDPGQTWKPRRLLVQGEQLLLSLLGGLATIDLAAPGGPRRLALDTDHAGIPALAGGNGWIAVVDERDLGGIDILAPSPDGQLEHLARIEIEGRPIDLGASADRLVVLGDPDVFESAPISRRYLEVFDLTDAWTPRPIGKQAIRLANQVQVSEGRAYTSGGGFVEVFDIDGADIPAYLGHLTRAGEGCAGPRRGFLYCGGGSRYAVIDVRDPATMQPVPGIQTDLACPRPELAAGELYCGFNARGDGGWRFDLGDPARPRLVGYAGGLGRLHAAASYGEQVLLLSASPIQAQAEHRLELAVVQQGTPARTSQAPAWQGVAVPGQIAIAGSRAYLTLDESSQAPMLGTIDISTPTAPRLIAQLPLAFEPWQLAADASLVYLTTGLTERVHVFDMRSPDSPIELPSIELESVPYSIAAADGSLWVGGETGLTGYSVDPETGTLQELGHLPSRRALGALDDGGINTLSVQGSWVFAADQLANGSRRIPSGPALILAVDIGDPRSPVVAETHQAPSTRYRIYGLASESKQLLVDAIDRTTWLGELWFIDMEAPDQARLSSVWRADTSESAIGDIALRDGLAFAYLGHSGIAVLGTDLEPEPRLLKQIVLPGDQNDSLTLADDGTLWTTDWEAGLIALRFDRDALPTPTPGATPTRRPLPTAAATSTPGGAGTELPRVLEAIYLPLVHH
ncbi:MAG: hypothetical protein H6648_06715 [Caldilineae bacterium]|nr:hypothetical protein [Chloroflexota bacterium]MCB9176837.1 hypothetical protein [Caldilineae bacterium]